MRLRQRFLTLKQGFGASLQLDARKLTESINSTVTTWTDLSGNNRNPTQATSGSRATITLNANGQKSLSFNGSNFYEIASSTSIFNQFHNGTESVAYIVASPANSSNPDTVAYAFFGNNNTASAAIGTSVIWDDRSGFGYNNAIRAFSSNGVGGQYPATAVLNNLWNAQTWAIANLVFDSDATTVANRIITKFNGGSNLVSNSLNNTPSNSNATYNMQIGTPGISTTLPFVGSMASIILFNNGSSLNASMRKRIEHALAVSFKIRCL